MGEENAHYATVLRALRKLTRNTEPNPRTISLLAGGGSGSFVYALEGINGRQVLKVTLPGKGSQVLERARREARFYQDLARHVPLAVPRLIALDASDEDGVVILLSAYLPAPAPDQWRDQDCVEIARQLSDLHAFFWDAPIASAISTWLPRKPTLTSIQCGNATQKWHALLTRTDLAALVEPRLRRLEALLAQLTMLESRLVTLPPTLCHGDCHAGNLLRGSNDEWIWADWQAVRLGPGVDDLAFFLQRMLAASNEPPPYDRMTQAYADGLARQGSAAAPREEIERNLAWSELRSWLMDWPEYLGSLPGPSVARVLRRIDALSERIL